MPLNYVKYKLKGGAIFYAIVISLLILLVCQYFILGKYLHKRSINQWDLVNRGENAAENGIFAGIQKNPSLNTTLEINDEIINLGSKITVERISWGAYAITKSTSTLRNRAYTKYMLTGHVPDRFTALFISDHNSDVSASTNVVLKGDVFFPGKKIKTAYLAGNYGGGKKQVYGEIKASKNSLPALNSEITTFVDNYRSFKFGNNDSVVDVSNLSTYKIERSFAQKTLVIVSESNLYLDQVYFKGNIIVVSKGEINISSYARLQDVIIIGDQIIVRNNFKGNTQLFASDSLVIGNKCLLEYPSVAGIINPTRKKSSMLLGNSSRIFGLLLHYDTSKPDKSSITLCNASTLIIGTFYSNATSQLPEKILGNVYCDKTNYRTPEASHTNLLKDVYIDPSGNGKYYANPCILNDAKELKSIKWLY